jgi:hypothetical protein
VSPPRRKKQHGTAYRWIRAYLPIMAMLFALLAVVWVYTSFINPPLPTPAQQWARIEEKWSPAREKARAAVAANTLDFAKQQAAYKDFYAQTKGWVDEVEAVKKWAIPDGDTTTAANISSFVSTGKAYLTTLEQINAATTPYQVADLAATVTEGDLAFDDAVYVVRKGLSLSVTEPASSPLAFPSVNPTPTPIPSPSPTPTPTPTPTADSSAAPSQSATASPAASPS